MSVPGPGTSAGWGMAKKKKKKKKKKMERIKRNPHFKKLKIIVKRRFFSISVGEIRLLLSWARGFI